MEGIEQRNRGRKRWREHRKFHQVVSVFFPPHHRRFPESTTPFNLDEFSLCKIEHLLNTRFCIRMYIYFLHSHSISLSVVPQKFENCWTSKSFQADTGGWWSDSKLGRTSRMKKKLTVSHLLAICISGPPVLRNSDVFSPKF